MIHKFVLTKDIKKYHLKEGMIFEWNDEEQCYITKNLPWFLTPLIDKAQLKDLLEMEVLKKK